MTAISLLRSYQKHRHLTQEALAQHLGVTAAQVSVWLAGKRGPSLETAFQVEERTGGAVPAKSWRSPRRSRRGN